MHGLPLRLTPGCDLRRELERSVGEGSATGGFVVSGIGSLTQASLRFAAVDAATLIVEPLELLTLAGSLTPDGAHLHALVATADGRVIGGHVGYGCIVRTTAEILVAMLPDWRLGRAHDPASGYAELTIARPDAADG